MTESTSRTTTPGRRTGWFLVAVAIWNFFIWLTFAKNLYQAHADGEDRATGYWVAHSVLIVVDLALGVVFAVLGVRMLRARR
jgi:hypothetical protein